MSKWHVDAGLAVLIGQMQARYKGIIIGTIGDAAHAGRKSDHNPDPDGSVDAADFMIGKRFTVAEAHKIWRRLYNANDLRIKYVIWNRLIWEPIPGSKVKANPKRYTGDDPHTDHLHISVDDAHHTNPLAKWKI